jgi:calcineurin-like phosphoesterase family protein
MISLLIVSDIHASANRLERDDAVSWFSTLPEYDQPHRNPFIGIPELLEREELTVDLVLCPGDLADCAEPVAQEKAWARLEALRERIGARRLIGTVGNHDIDSRGVFSSFDPKTTLQSLTPIFPGLQESDCDFFWSRNFVLTHEGDVRFLVLNSCAFHGIHSGEPTNPHREYIHGRVSDRTIEAILKNLNGDNWKLNVLLVHHHVYRNEHITSADYSEMKNGMALIRALSDNTTAPWLIVHGHQHYPDLFYASGHSRSPVVLSAGSMSRRLTGALAQRGLNQIYHLELPVEAFDGWSPCGIVRSWHWTDKVGWKKNRFR